MKVATIFQIIVAILFKVKYSLRFTSLLGSDAYDHVLKINGAIAMISYENIPSLLFSCLW
jgi:hypothetical protein